MLKSLDNEKTTAEKYTMEPEMQKDSTSDFNVLRVLLQIGLMAVILIGAYFAMNKLIASKPVRTARPQVDVTLPVEAINVILGDQRPTVSLFGEIASARSVDIRTSVSGEVVSVNPKLSAGNSVEEGEELFSIDRINLQSALAEAKSNLAQTEATILENEANISSERAQLEFAETQLSLAIADLERAKKLGKNGTLTQKSIDDRLLLVSQREQAVQLRRNNITVQEARTAQQRAVRERQLLGVERAERDLKNAVVTAPFAGVVRTSIVEIGRILSANDVAVSMYDNRALDVRFTLTNAQYGRIAIDGDPLIGRDVDLTWTVGETDYAYKAKVTRIGADIATERGGVDIYARLEENTEVPVQLRPGAFVEIKVGDRLYKNAARVPETAIFEGETAYIIKDGQLQSRKIVLAAFDGADAIIIDGLSDGEQVLTTRLSEIEEGLKVRIYDVNGVEAAGQAPAPEASPARPSPELLATAKELSGLSDTAWDALSREDRRSYLQKAREAAGAPK